MSNIFIDKRNATAAVKEWGHEGNDTLLGSRFGDNLAGAAGNDTIHGNGGDDVIVDYTVFGPQQPILFMSFDHNEPSEVLSALSANGEFVEEQVRYFLSTMSIGGNDKYYGEDGKDRIFGLRGNDLVDGGAQDDEVYGGSGNDTVIGGEGNDLMAGDSGSDYLLGGNGNDVMVGGSGNDRIEGGMGGDTIYGQGGSDTVIYDNSRTGVEIDLAAGSSRGLNGSTPSEAHGDELHEIENVEGSRQDDIISGNRLANDLFGNFGNDVLEGGADGDRLDGSVGNDRVTYERSAAGVDVVLEDTAVRRTSSASGGDAQGDRLFSIENLVGSNFSDRLTGNALNNKLEGLNGDDTLAGEGGRDSLLGGKGQDMLLGMDQDDFLIGGGGSDRIDGGAGTDTASFADLVRGIGLVLGEGTANGHALSSEGVFGEFKLVVDTLISIENITGSQFADGLQGNLDRNVMKGGNGDDRFVFTAGGDIYDGEADTDTVDLSISTATTIDLASSIAMNDAGASATLRSIENVIGSNFADRITGTSGNNVITAGDGPDIMTGNGGNDTFVFRTLAEIGGSTPDARDVINDFSEGDLLDFRELDADGEVAGTQHFDFIGNAVFTGAGQEMRVFVGSGGNLNIVFDADGDRRSDGQIRLIGVRDFDSSDFLM